MITALKIVQTATDYVGGAKKALARGIKIDLLLLYNKKCGLATAQKQQKEVIKMSNDNNSLSHTKWNCK